MYEETSIEEMKAEAWNLLEQFKTAVNMPRLYVYQFFENMRNEIDIQSFKALNETNKERIYEHQAKLIVKVQELKQILLDLLKVLKLTDLFLQVQLLKFPLLQ